MTKTEPSDITPLRFAAKVLHLSGKSFGERGHYERLLHERHWAIGHNACKGAKTDLERTSLLTCKLCASDMTAADDTYCLLYTSPSPRD